MRRSVLVGVSAFALCGGAAFANPGNDSVITQSASDNSAYVNQVDSAWGSQSAVEQLDRGNAASVTQSDMGGGGEPIPGEPGEAYANESSIVQNVTNLAQVIQEHAGLAGDPANTNSSDIEQLGTDGVVSVEQRGAGNAAYATQDGDSQRTTVVQSGFGATRSTTNQEGADNDAQIHQTSDSDSEELTSTVVQDGDFNTALVEQAEGAADSLVVQSGALNNVTVVQSNDGRGRASSIVDQFGREHAAEVTQSGAEAASRIEQYGVEHHASVTQESTGYGVFSHVLQSEGWNDAVVEQVGEGPMESQINQAGAGNTALVSQHGRGPLASSVIQGGVRLNAEVSQHDSFWAESEILQYGHELDVSVDQSGLRLTSEVTQDGSDLTTEVTQRSHGKTSVVTQSGEFNTANVDQSGLAAATSQITQTGVGNGAFVVQ